LVGAWSGFLELISIIIVIIGNIILVAFLVAIRAFRWWEHHRMHLSIAIHGFLLLIVVIVDFLHIIFIEMRVVFAYVIFFQLLRIGRLIRSGLNARRLS